MIYTFYSYKGGVGRSMALANIAECFYLQGLRVIMVDWDLEAPGLETFFFENVAPKAPEGRGTDVVLDRLGLLDMFTEYKRCYSDLQTKWAPPPSQETGGTAPSTDALAELGGEALAAMAPPAPAAEFSPEAFQATLSSVFDVRSFLFPIHGSLTNGAHLSLLPAGWRGRDRFARYAEAVQSFDWKDFYASYQGFQYFEWLAAELHRYADVVFIDSRTGVTEMGGVCARQLADVVVSFCAPNFQNIEGVSKMVESFQRPDVDRERKNRPLQTLVVPTRIEPKDLDRLRNFLAFFSDRVDKRAQRPKALQDRPFWDLRIPFVSAYAYEEKRVIGPPGTVEKLDPTESLETAYWRLSTTLARLAPPSHAIQSAFAGRLKSEFPSPVPETVISYETDGEAGARKAHALLDAAGILLWPDLDHQSASPAQALEQSSAMLIILSPGALQSSAIRQEVRQARRRGTSVYLLEPGEAAGPPDALPFWLHRFPVYRIDQDGQKILQVLQHPGPPATAPMMAPPAPADALGFRGAPEFVERLRGSARAPEAFAIFGPAGAGKSLFLAVTCADPDVADRFAGVIWVDVGGRMDLASQVRDVWRCLRPENPSRTPIPDEELRTRVKSELAAGNFLLVIDDAAEGEALRFWLEARSTCTCVILTRDRRLAAECAPAAFPMFPLDAAGQDPRLLGWPLLISLYRRALQARIRQGEIAESAERVLLQRLSRQGVLAFDVANAESRDDSIARSFEATLNLLAPDQRAQFFELVRFGPWGDRVERVVAHGLTLTAGTGKAAAPEGAKIRALVERAAELSLIEIDEQGSVRLHPFTRAYYEAGDWIERPAAPREPAAGLPAGTADRRAEAEVESAVRLLAGEQIEPERMQEIALTLKRAGRFDYARRLLARLRKTPYAQEPESRKLYLGQQHALCTYKDTELPGKVRFDRALAILRDVDDPDASTSQETLGLAGAIFKHKWGFDGQIQNLERSLHYYRRGFDLGVEDDSGYTAINAAFVLDLLAAQELHPGSSNPRREEARRIRERITTTLPPMLQGPLGKDLENDWWFLVTVAEAYFGLGRYAEARYWLKEARALNVADWELETTARQLGALALLGDARAAGAAEAWHTLRVFLGNDPKALRSVTAGKVGLALSGGGFRAALFHVGVLARLAEMDVLRHVEVLSCVSGGSIIGAHYYLEVKKLLETVPDEQITAQTYIDLVARIERDFLGAVQRNIRMRVAANPWYSLKAAFKRGFSRTERMGQLLDDFIYSGPERAPFMDELRIQPAGTPPGFSPRLDNWRRTAKVPILILNATTLNTGHVWQFTPSWMGESPHAVTTEIDSNDLLRRMYYEKAPPPHQRIPLGRAVAASACVPGLFDSIDLDGLYPGRTVRLVDGGVHDNQGIAGLLEQDCAVILVSDASGQMNSERKPPAHLLGVLGRTNSILMARVREAEYRELDARRRSMLLRGMMYIHLRRDLPTETVDWVGCLEPYKLSDDAEGSLHGPLTSYGIFTDVQESLAAIRTDLDSFNDREAYTLMYSGYKMTGPAYADGVPTLPPAAGQATWRFLSLQPSIDKAKGREEAYGDLLEILSIGRYKALKVCRFRGYTALSAALILAAGAALGWGLFESFRWIADRSWLGLVGAFFAVLVALMLAARLVWRKELRQGVTGILMTAASPFVWLHLWLVDAVYLRKGAAPQTSAPTWGQITVRWLSALALAAALLWVGLIGPLFAARKTPDTKAGVVQPIDSTR